MKLETIQKQIDSYQHKFDLVDAWASKRKEKFTKKIMELKKKLA